MTPWSRVLFFNKWVKHYASFPLQFIYLHKCRLRVPWFYGNTFYQWFWLWCVFIRWVIGCLWCPGKSFSRHKMMTCNSWFGGFFMKIGKLMLRSKICSFLAAISWILTTAITNKPAPCCPSSPPSYEISITSFSSSPLTPLNLLSLYTTSPSYPHLSATYCSSPKSPLYPIFTLI